MEPSHIISYLKDNYPIKAEQLDSLQFGLTEHLYFFGDHFKNPKEISSINFRYASRKFLKYLFVLYKIYQNKNIPAGKNTILSNSYFSINTELKNLGYNVYCPSWSMSPDRNVLTSFEILTAGEKITKQFRDLDFNELLSPAFLEEIAIFEKKMKAFFVEQKISSIFVPADVDFFSNLSIKVCKVIGVPSFIFLHGLPQAIEICKNNRSDYLIVWGEKIKDNYIKDGMNPDKIFVSGHPFYKDFKTTEVKFGLDNIVVLTKSVSGTDFGDRANSILYLYSIEKVLKKLGVKAVNLRSHPGENPKWYMKFVNKGFYRIDSSGSKSIKKASVVIGPTSSVLLESVYYGINYLVYEPIVQGLDFTGRRLFSPFDGSDARVSVANTEDQLEYMIRNKIKIDPSFFTEYSKTPFDLSFVKKLI